MKTQVDGGRFAALGLSVEDARSYPVLTGRFSMVHPSDPLEATGLRAGDRLIRMGDADLRGVGTLGFKAQTQQEAGRDLRIPLVFERGGERRQTSLALAPMSTFRALLAVSFAFSASAMFLLFRGGSTPLVRACFYTLMCPAIMSTAGLLSRSGSHSFTGSRLELYASVGVFAGANLAFFPLFYHFFFIFPDERAPEGRWHRILPWFFGVPMGLFAGLATTSWPEVGESGRNLTVALGTAGLLVVATRKYRHAGLVARRQMKWVLYGAYCVALPVLVASALVAFEPGLGWLFLVGVWVASLFPLFLLISVVRFNLFDIDRLLSATMSYNILIVLLVAGGFVVVPRIAAAASGLLRIDPMTAQVALSFALAAVLIPAHRRLRPQIDRVFFKERYAVDQGVAELLLTLSHCQDSRALLNQMGEVVNRLFRPETGAVYALVESSYVPVFVEGRVVPPAFEAENLLIRALRQRRAPLALAAAGRRPHHPPLDPFDRAALETLQAEVVVPVRQGEALVAFLCLGPKRSGDVYTATDLALLTAVAEAASHQLQRFDQDEVIREGREMQESLRRYVPGAVAEQLSSGTELYSGEREVTVLFVDIRDYTSFSESRRPEDIFSTVNRYTESVSQIVHEHGGNVVEFQGDGMMAVFGAPQQLANKEKAAVQAAREIDAAVAELTIEDTSDGETTISVGVGIATGNAFLGNIQSIDRMIWSAIGSTTNLAGRLQGLTRDLDAAIVIDAATREALGAAGRDFDRRQSAPIRGGSQTHDFFALYSRPSALLGRPGGRLG